MIFLHCPAHMEVERQRFCTNFKNIKKNYLKKLVRIIITVSGIDNRGK